MRLAIARLYATIGLAALSLAGCDIGYIARGAYQEGRLLWNRRPISTVLAKSDLPQDIRAKLEMVLKVRSFAQDQLGLDVGGAYSTVTPVDQGAVSWVLMAAYRDSLTSYNWWFPIVGYVPYRGYFLEEQARAEANRLEAQKFDTFVRPTVAFSTLGYFNDPLLSNLLTLDCVVLAGVLIHELFHRTFFLASDVPFNESSANYVGSRGAVEFFSKTEGENAPSTRTAREILTSQLKFAEFLRHEEARLLDLYQSKLGADEIAKRREAVFSQIKADYAAMKVTLTGLERYDLDRAPLNNAVFISYRIYFRDLDNFAAIDRINHGDVRRTIEEIIAQAKAHSDDPFYAIWQAAQSAPRKP